MNRACPAKLVASPNWTAKSFPCETRKMTAAPTQTSGPGDQGRRAASYDKGQGRAHETEHEQRADPAGKTEHNAHEPRRMMVRQGRQLPGDEVLFRKTVPELFRGEAIHRKPSWARFFSHMPPRAERPITTSPMNRKAPPPSPACSIALPSKDATTMTMLRTPPARRKRSRMKRR